MISVSPPAMERMPCAMVAQGLAWLVQSLPMSEPVFAT